MSRLPTSRVGVPQRPQGTSQIPAQQIHSQNERDNLRSLLQAPVGSSKSADSIMRRRETSTLYSGPGTADKRGPKMRSSEEEYRPKFHEVPSSGDVAPRPYWNDNDSNHPHETNIGQRDGFPAPKQASSSQKRSRVPDLRDFVTQYQSRGGEKLGETLQLIRDDWNFMTFEDCNSVQRALELMDNSSIGKADKFGQFRQLHQSLQQSLQVIVNEHYQGFNSAIGTYNTTIQSIELSQRRVRSLKETLSRSRKDLTLSSPEAKSLASRSQTLDHTLQVLSAIDNLRLVPEKLEARISEKRFLSGVDILTHALSTIGKPEFSEIGALQDLRLYLKNQEISLVDILIEELHNHLYLKSPYTDDRWRPYNEGPDDASKSSPSPPSNDESTKATALKLPTGTSKGTLKKFLENVELSHPMVEDASRNPEADSLYYIRLVIESLSNLGHLQDTLDALSQRQPIELYKLVERTNLEVDQRHSAALRAFGATRKDPRQRAFDFGGEIDAKSPIINDLFWTLYSKLEAVFEGHRVIFEVFRGISKRSSRKQTELVPNYEFLGSWQVIQNEIRSLLHDYLSAIEHGAVADTKTGGAPTTINAMFMQRNDVFKGVYKLSGTNLSSHRMRTEQDELATVLKLSVPGLVSDYYKPLNSSVENPHQASDGSATGHKLLIEPSVFNMGLLLPPSLDFLQRIRDIVPPSSDIAPSIFTSFLDDFIVNVFSPQLEDTLRDFTNTILTGSDCTLCDSHWPSFSRRPVSRAAVSFVDLMTAFSGMLEMLPLDPSFAQLVIDLMNSFLDKSRDWYQDLTQKIVTTDGHAKISKALSATWVGDAELTVTSFQTLWAREDLYSNLDTEWKLKLASTATSLLSMSNLIKDRNTISAMCLLYSSLKWLADKLVNLRSPTPPRESCERGFSSDGKRWARPGYTAPSTMMENSSQTFLPVTAESAKAFDDCVGNVRDLAQTVLYNLRVEVQFHVCHFLGILLDKGVFDFEVEMHEPDPAVLALNADLTSIEEKIGAHVMQREHQFIFGNLSDLMNHLLISGASRIKVMNTHGAKRMGLNILVLQQNLRNIAKIPGTSKISKTAHLDSSSAFYSLFLGGPDEIVAKAKDGYLQFQHDDVKALINLYYSESLLKASADGQLRRESAMQARKSLNSHLIQLSEAMWAAEC